MTISKDEQKSGRSEWLEKTPRVNIEFPPRKQISKNVKANDITIGDLHANAIKFIYFLAREGIVRIKPCDYNLLVDSYEEIFLAAEALKIDQINLEMTALASNIQNKQLKLQQATNLQATNKLTVEIAELTQQFNLLDLDLRDSENNYQTSPNIRPAIKTLRNRYKTFVEIINKMEIVDHNILVRLIGDEVADRGASDYLVLKIIEKLITSKVRIEILASNHGNEFLDAFEKIEILGELDRKKFQHAQIKGNFRLAINQNGSLMRLLASIKAGVINYSEVKKLISLYKRVLKATSYSLSLNNTIIFYDHAPSDLTDTENLAKKLNVDYNKNDLPGTINAINQNYMQLCEHNKSCLINLFGTQENTSTREHFPLESKTWNRNREHLHRPEKFGKLNIAFAFGHTPVEKLDNFPHIIPLDSDLGKDEIIDGEYDRDFNDGQYIVFKVQAKSSNTSIKKATENNLTNTIYASKVDPLLTSFIQMNTFRENYTVHSRNTVLTTLLNVYFSCIQTAFIKFYTSKPTAESYEKLLQSYFNILNLAIKNKNINIYRDFQDKFHWMFTGQVLLMNGDVKSCEILMRLAKQLFYIKSPQAYLHSLKSAYVELNKLASTTHHQLPSILRTIKSDIKATKDFLLEQHLRGLLDSTKRYLSTLKTSGKKLHPVSTFIKEIEVSIAINSQYSQTNNFLNKLKQSYNHHLNPYSQYFYWIKKSNKLLRRNQTNAASILTKLAQDLTHRLLPLACITVDIQTLSNKNNLLLLLNSIIRRSDLISTALSEIDEVTLELLDIDVTVFDEIWETAINIKQKENLSLEHQHLQELLKLHQFDISKITQKEETTQFLKMNKK